ncbi:MAG TPA: type II CAAX endopeptidase family protein [Candidatus Saccharibacteria bacterium]|nr:type II CAAX endopeptidase family protein [Candidatus Saccharibacteria bacterium]
MSETTQEKLIVKNNQDKAEKSVFWKPVPTVFLTIGVFLTSQVIGGLLILMIPSIFGMDKARSEAWLDTVGAKFGLIILIELFVLIMLNYLLKRKKRNFKYLGLKLPKITDFIYALLALGVYFLSFAVVTVVVKAIVPGVNLEQEQQIGFDTAQQGLSLLLVFLSLVVAAPFVEEVLARGFLYTGLKNGFPKWAAVIITSVLFAAAHLQFGSGAELLWIAAIDTFILSLVLIYLREKTGGLGAPIMLHMMKNGIAFTLLFVFQVR